MNRVSFLIENELERAELVLNAKSITDKLQDIAEDLAKVEVQDLMPMLDPMTAAFGPEISERFNQVTTEKIRGLVEAVKLAKEALGTEVNRLESILNGETPANDMVTDAGAPDMDAPAPVDAPDDDAMTDAAAPAQSKASDEMDDIFGDDQREGNPAGRAKKEVTPTKESALSRTPDPDRMVLEAFRRRLAEGNSPARAARMTATRFGIDPSDVAMIVREATNTRRLSEQDMAAPTVTKTKDGQYVAVSTDPRTKQVKVGEKKRKPDEAVASLVSEGDKKPDADKDGVPDWADKNPFKKGPPKTERKPVPKKGR
jgi:hypothetical protein